MIANLFAFRSTNPSILNHVSNPIGSDSDFYLQKSASEADLVIACWGNPSRQFNRDKEVISLISNLYCLKQKWYTTSPTLFFQGNKTISLYTINSYSI